MARLHDLELAALNPQRLWLVSQLVEMDACSIDHAKGTVAFKGSGEQWLSVLKGQGSRFSRQGRLHRRLCDAMTDELRATGTLRLEHEDALDRFANESVALSLNEMLEQYVPEYSAQVDLGEAIRLGRQRASEQAFEE